MLISIPLPNGTRENRQDFDRLDRAEQFEDWLIQKSHVLTTNIEKDGKRFVVKYITQEA